VNVFKGCQYSHDYVFKTYAIFSVSFLFPISFMLLTQASSKERQLESMSKPPRWRL